MDELEKFGKGGIREDIPDPRDFQWGKDIGNGAIPFDWEKGYDVEQEVSDKLGINFKLSVKNQGNSSSCGGQAWAYYGQILDTLNDGVTQEKSAKFIYCQTHVGTGGSGGRENCSICINQGWGNEADTPSYQSNLPPSEDFITNNDITVTARNNAYWDRGLAYANVLDRNVENIATAVRDNHGCIFGITGTNNGTWRSPFPQPPVTFSNAWNHWIFVGKVKLINSKKYFGIINSWGKEVGEDGWQWISEEYITTFILGYPVIFSIWTMVARADVTLPPPFVFTKTLRYGMIDPEVKVMQEILKKLLYFPNIPTTNTFGHITLLSLKLFQEGKGLVNDGIAGPLTRKELQKFI